MSNEENLNTVAAENPASEEALDKVESAQQSEAQAPTEESAPVSDEKKVAEPTEEEAPAADEAKDEAAPAEENNVAEKPSRKDKKRGKGMSKLFKLIYFPLVAVFAVLMLVFSIIDGAFGYSPSAYKSEYYDAVNKHVAQLSAHPRSAMSAMSSQGTPIGVVAARNYIKDALVAGGFSFAEEDKPDVENDEKQYTTTGWKETAGTYQPTVTFHTSVPSVELQNEMGIKNMLAGYELTNVVAAIPSRKDNADAVVITVRYDGRTDSLGAADNAAFAANAVQSLIEYVKSGETPNNDIIVVFAEELDGAFGSYAFFDSFRGFDNAASRAKAGISLDAYGNGGTLALTDSAAAPLGYINAVTAVSGSSFNSSVAQSAIPEVLARGYAAKAFGEVPAVQIAVLGGMDAAQSPKDNAENLSQAVVRQQSALLKNYLQKFGKAELKFEGEGNGKTAVFSYFDAGSVAYTDVASYVIGALLIVLLGVTIALTVVKKTFSLKRMLIAAAAQLLVVLGSVVAMYAAYFLVTLMLTGFGVLPIHAITVVSHFNAGILIAAMLVSLASAFGFTILFKKTFKITASDSVRGTSVLFAVAGIIMSFACPAYSFMTVWLGMLMTAITLVTVCLHKTFKDKFGFGMDRLFLYVIPVALCLPLVMAQFPVLMQLLPLTLLPVLMSVFTAMLGTVVPYLERTQPIFDKVAKKLPMRTQRVERTVVEKVEDKAKKGKFTTTTVRRIEKEKVAINYKNYFGISVVAVLSVVIALFSGGFGVTSDKTLTGYRSFDNAVYNDALVYELVTTDSGTTKRVVIDDLMLYKYARYAIDGFDWDGTKYVKTVTNTITYNEPEIKSNEGTFTVTPYEGGQSTVTLTIPSARSITSITVKEKSKEAIPDYEGFKYEYYNQSEITLRLPYGFGSFTLEFEGSTPSTVNYEEHVSIDYNETGTILDQLEDWVKLKRYYSDTTVAESMRGAVVIKREFKNLQTK